MYRVLFVCHGNICRSPMAEYVLKDLTARRGLAGQFRIASAATSREELGNPVYPPARRKLEAMGVPCGSHRAVQPRREDYGQYDLLLGMDGRNICNMLHILGGDPEGKVRRLLDFTQRPGDIADPWYSGDFDAAYRDVLEGCQGLLDALL